MHFLGSSNAGRVSRGEHFRGDAKRIVNDAHRRGTAHCNHLALGVGGHTRRVGHGHATKVEVASDRSIARVGEDVDGAFDLQSLSGGSQERIRLTMANRDEPSEAGGDERRRLLWRERP